MARSWIKSKNGESDVVDAEVVEEKKSDRSHVRTGHHATTPTTPKKERADFYEIIGRIIDFVVKVLGVLPYTVGRILENFTDHSKPGIRALAGALFFLGTVLSSDNFYQAFGGTPLFPWFEDRWIGYGWFVVWLTIPFWAAVTISLGVQWVESQAIRGKTPDQAKKDYEEIKNHKTPAPNSLAIDLVELRRLDYKRSGVGEHNLLGVFVIIVFILDFASAFHARNPWGQPASLMLGMTLYNVISLIAGEVGLSLWRRAHGKN
jgi:hypothetical protein